MVTFHDILHGFHYNRGTGTVIMELNIAKELASIDHDPLFKVFLNLQKSYDTIDSGRILQTLEGYGSGPNMQGRLAKFWENQEVVAKKNVCHGTYFRETVGTIQGGIAFLTLFNV